MYTCIYVLISIVHTFTYIRDTNMLLIWWHHVLSLILVAQLCFLYSLHIYLYSFHRTHNSKSFQIQTLLHFFQYRLDKYKQVQTFQVKTLTSFNFNFRLYFLFKAFSKRSLFPPQYYIFKLLATFKTFLNSLTGETHSFLINIFPGHCQS